MNDKDRLDYNSAGGGSRKELSLAQARLVSFVMYASIVVYAVVGSSVEWTSRPPSLPAFPAILMGIAVIEYAISLFLEARLLSGRRWQRPRTARLGPGDGPAPTAVIVVSAIGVSIGIYGFVLAMISFATWPWWFYGLAALHGIHLQLRWDRYEEAVRSRKGYSA